MGLAAQPELSLPKAREGRGNLLLEHFLCGAAGFHEAGEVLYRHVRRRRLDARQVPRAAKGRGGSRCTLAAGRRRRRCAARGLARVRMGASLGAAAASLPSYVAFAFFGCFLPPAGSSPACGTAAVLGAAVAVAAAGSTGAAVVF